ncbi:MAG: pyridoxal 5'-phosphate synthase glutaminase subunit PdxT [Candidatus Zixiibacteriota bacterium]
MNRPLTVGLLAIQGDFDLHRRAVEPLGHRSMPVRTASDLNGIDALIMPGGESTTMRKLMLLDGLFDAILEFARSYPIMGTCAGLILLGRRIVDAPDEPTLKLIDCDVDRNAYGSQYHSFRQTGHVHLENGARPLEMVFIRAPRLVRVGDGVQILGWLEDEPTMVRQGNILAMTFHPELAGDPSVHRFFLTEMAERASQTVH